MESETGVAIESDPVPSTWKLVRFARLSNRARALSALLVLLTLLPTLLYPLGSDGGLFFVSGGKLLEGAVYYRDIIDLKPPLLYYMYATAIALFGDGQISIRILDLLLQLATCWMIAMLVRRASGNEFWGMLSALLYAIQYVALSPFSTALPESWVGLFGIPMLLLLDRAGAGRAICAGMLAGTLFLLKFPLAILLPVAAVTILLTSVSPSYARWRDLAALVSGFVLAAGLLPLYLVLFDAGRDFMLVGSYTRGYVAVSQSSLAQAVRMMNESLVGYFGDYFSMTFSLLLAAGIIAGLRRRTPLRPAEVNLVGVATVSMILLLCTVIIEGKYAAYQFSRIYPFTAIPAGLGALLILDILRRGSERLIYRSLVITGLAGFLLLFSPLPRYIRHAYGGIVLATRGSDAYDSYYNRGGQICTQGEIESIGRTVRQQSGPQEKMFVVSSMAGLAYYHADRLPPFKIYHSAFLIPTFAPAEWKDSTREFIMRDRPRFILVQLNDSMPSLSGSSITGEQAFRALPGVDSLLNTHYTRIRQTPCFDLYRYDDDAHGVAWRDSTLKGRMPE